MDSTIHKHVLFTCCVFCILSVQMLLLLLSVKDQDTNTHAGDMQYAIYSHLTYMLVPVVVHTQKYTLHDYIVNTILQHCTVVLVVQEDLKPTRRLFQTLNHVSRLVPTPGRYIIIICITIYMKYKCKWRRRKN